MKSYQTQALLLAQLRSDSLNNYPCSPHSLLCLPGQTVYLSRRRLLHSRQDILLRLLQQHLPTLDTRPHLPLRLPSIPDIRLPRQTHRGQLMLGTALILLQALPGRFLRAHTHLVHLVRLHMLLLASRHSLRKRSYHPSLLLAITPRSHWRMARVRRSGIHWRALVRSKKGQHRLLLSHLLPLDLAPHPYEATHHPM
jgi:hypothetical protein